LLLLLFRAYFTRPRPSFVRLSFCAIPSQIGAGSHKLREPVRCLRPLFWLTCWATARFDLPKTISENAETIGVRLHGVAKSAEVIEGAPS